MDVIANEFIPANALAGTPLGECYSAYRQSLTRHHFLTFSLIVASALEALEDRDIRERVRGPLRHLLVDEYQDINPSQERLIELLSAAPVQLTVVGDDDQSIYQWRGSDVRNILTFKQRRRGARSVDLDTNRRSRPAIVDAANRFSKTIANRLDKTMKEYRPAGPNQIVPWSAVTDETEAGTIADTVIRLESSGLPLPRYRRALSVCSYRRASAHRGFAGTGHPVHRGWSDGPVSAARGRFRCRDSMPGLSMGIGATSRGGSSVRQTSPGSSTG